MATPTCPQPDQLEAFVKGALEPQSLGTIYEHLTSCEHCSSLLAQLEKDDSFHIGHQGSSVLEMLAEPQLAALQAHCKQLLERDSPPSTELGATPLQVGEYTLLQPIARGGMGHVYEALHRRLQRKVAIKLLATGRTASARYRQRFLEEMRAIGLCEHRNIVRATDAGEHDGHLYLVMELLHGRDISRLLRESGPLGVADACEIARQAAAGLQHVHESGIVHRDVKPSNLYLTQRGEVKLLDLGLARLRLDEGKTESGILLGTMDYLAPEQAARAKDASIRSDLYGLGCTLYAMLAGAAPYYKPDQSATEKLLAHLNEPIPDIRKVRPEVPDRVAELITRLIAKRPEDRPALPSEVEAELLPFANPHLPATVVGVKAPAVELPKPAPETDARALPRSRRGLLLALPLAAAAVVGGAYVGGLLEPWGPREPEVGKWFDLLRQHPTPVLFPNKDRGSTCSYDRRTEQFWASSDQTVLFGLGKSNTGNFQLQIALRQQVWTGGAGLYFGQTEQLSGDDRVLEIQAVEIRPRTPRDDSEAFSLTHVSRTINVAGTAQPRVNSKLYGGTAISLPTRREYVLEIRIASARLISVKWDGRELIDEIWPSDHPLKNPPLVAKGGYGLINIVSATTFNRARVLLLED